MVSQIIKYSVDFCKLSNLSTVNFYTRWLQQLTFWPFKIVYITHFIMVYITHFIMVFLEMHVSEIWLKLNSLPSEPYNAPIKIDIHSNSS